MIRPIKSERGQMLVLLSIVLVALLGFTALAIDGGMVFSNRRFAQNAADAASLAGGGAASKILEDPPGLSEPLIYEKFTCSDATVNAAKNAALQAAINRGASNAFTLDGDITDKHGVEVTCVDDPAHFDKHIDVKVMVTQETQTSFAHLFFNDALTGTVESIVRVRPRRSYAFGYAIASLSEDCGTKDGGVVLDGTSTIKVTGGGIFSNSCMSAGGTSLIVEVTPANPGDPQPGINLVDNEIVLSGNPSISPAPVGNYAHMPVSVPEPPVECVGATGGENIRINNGDVTVKSPGVYQDITVNNGGDLTLNAGTYCITGTVNIGGGTVVGNNVTFYMMNEDFGVTGGTVTLTSPAIDNINPMGGMLILMAESNHGNITLLGNGTSQFNGTVMGVNANIDAGGTSNVPQTFETQLIGQYVKVHGNAEIDIQFNDTQKSLLPTYIDLNK